MSGDRNAREVLQLHGKFNWSSSKGKLITAGLLLIILMLFISAGSADSSTDLNKSNITTVNPDPSLTVTPLPTTQILYTTIIPTIQTQITTTVPTTPTQNPTTIPTTLTQDFATATTTPILRAGSAVNDQFNIRAGKRVSQAERDAAADRFKAIYKPTPTTTRVIDTIAMDPGGIPHYFGPYANYANSPMPKGNITSITLVSGGSGYSANTTAAISDVYATGSGATANITVTAGVVTGITIQNPGTGYTAPIVTITDPDATGTGAVATASLGGTLTGGIRKFVDTLPGLNVAGANNLGNYIPIAIPDTTSYPPGGIGYTSAPGVTISDSTGSGANATATVAGGIVTGVTVISPGSGYSANPVVSFSGGGATTNAIGKATVVGGTITGISLVGCDYYVIELGEFNQTMHSDLSSTTFRGYRQVNTVDPTVSRFHYMGPLIISNTNRPVRIKFINSLPTGAGGNLFIPVDKTVMGAGMGPQKMNASPPYYTENRAVIHLHGGATPWISDGTPFQWITPAGENTPYPKGVSVYNVPDMPDPGNGAVTLFYTNQQSARLMFYHDHAIGLTRLNVYAGEAGGYLLTDETEQDMIAGTDVTGINPTLAKVLPDIGLPLIIQDKSFVDASTIAMQDPTWNWGTGTLNPDGTRQPRTGDLWYPHVYMPAQNPADLTGVNAFGRWHYGPWFWPPTAIPFGPVANPYYTGGEGTAAPWEPPMMPGVSNPSMTMEAYMDTPIVNGAAYPNLTVEPRAYRFRILNAGNDRFVNLQLYVANSTLTTADGRTNTEVDMVPAIATPGFPAGWPSDGREGGVPDPAKIGPSFIQIGTEGGFLPAPVVVPNQPVTWVSDPTRFDFGNVDKHALLIGAAERVDVIVDFSQYAGKTLILYNDAPAAFPAGITTYDYYTGDPDLTDTGGAPTTQPGYGPNTRTIMQIKVGPSVGASPYNFAALQGVFAKTASKRGVFEVSQDPVIIPQASYNSAYNKVFLTDTYVRIFDSFKNFTTVSGAKVNVTFQPKALHDEMGAAFDQYGRMSGILGLENVVTTGRVQNFILYNYASPPVDLIRDSMTPMSEPAPGDGTQIWKITHNGVDTHPLHWHLFNVQVINRVTWDGRILAPDATELGWKETVRTSPLEDTIVAMRPVAPTLPFEVPNSIHMIDPTMPEGAVLDGPALNGIVDPKSQPVTVLNHLVNYGWEYVWHCHILSHEEMDMMHSMLFAVAPKPPVSLTAINVSLNRTYKVNLSWTDNSLSETSFYLLRSTTMTGPWTTIASIPSTTGPQKGARIINYTDSTGTSGTKYNYVVLASNLVGDNATYAAPSVGFPRMEVNSTPSNVANVTAILPVANFTATPRSGTMPLTVKFTDSSTNTPTSWIWSFGDGSSVNATMQNPVHTYVIAGNYTVSLTTTNSGGSSSFTRTNYITVTVPAPVANFTATPRNGTMPLTVTFTDNSTNTPTSWIWSFGDGSTVNSTQQNPVHTYANAGIYTVSLNATNAGGSNTKTVANYITVTVPVPVANFTATPRIGTAPLTVTFTDNSTNTPTSWNWSFGDSSLVNATQRNPVHTYASAGNYTVSLTATNAGGSNTTTVANYITVNVTAPVANFVGTPTSGSLPLTVTFTDSSTNTPTSWFWVFGDGVTSTLQNPTHTYASTGTYTVSLNATNAAGSNTFTRTNYITVSSVTPVANFVGTPTSGSVPLTVTFTDSSTNIPTSWLWVFGDGVTSTLQNPTHTYASAGTYTVSLTATNAAGSNTITRTSYITVSSVIPVANFVGTPLSGAAPLTVIFTDSSTNTPTSWFWVFGDGATSTLQNPTHTYASAGTYNVAHTATNSAGSNTRTRLNYITVSSVIPVANFVGTPTSGGAPLTVTFTDSSTNTPTSWLWVFGDGVTSTLQNPTHTYVSAGTYTVSLTATNAAGSNSITRTSYITVSSVIPVANFVGTPLSGAAPLTVTFTDNSTNTPTSWSWSFGDGSSVNATQRNPVHTYAIAGTYTVSLTATNAAGSNTKTVANYITVNAAPAGDNVGVWRSSTTTFNLRNSAGATTTTVFGSPTDTPVIGDWDKNGLSEPGVWRSSTTAFYLRNSNGTITTIVYGSPTDTPVIGDWDKNGVSDVGVWRSSTTAFYLRNGNGTTTTIVYGSPTDKPVIGDWNGDGISDVGVWRSSTTAFYLRNSAGATTTTVYGLSTDTPIIGDWNGDLISEVGAWRNSAGSVFYRNGATSIAYGLPTDRPIIGKWV